MSEKSNNVALVIDTNRQRPPRHLEPTHRLGTAEHSPDTSCSSTTTLWSSSISQTPSTSTTIASAQTPHSGTADPAWLISKIDEYLAELDIPLAPMSKPMRPTLRIDVNPDVLASAERALPSSPEAIRVSRRISSTMLPVERKVRMASMATSPLDSDAVFLSPLFYRSFQRPEVGSMGDDAAPFPYSPGRECVFLDSGFCTTALSTGDSIQHRQRSNSNDAWQPEHNTCEASEACEASEKTRSPIKHRREADANHVPSIRLETPDDGEASSCNASDARGETPLGGSSPSKMASILECESGASSKRVDRKSVLSISFDSSLSAAMSEGSVAKSNNGGGSKCTMQIESPTMAASNCAASLCVPTPLRSQTNPHDAPTQRRTLGLCRSASAGNLVQRFQHPHVLHPTAPQKLAPTISDVCTTNRTKQPTRTNQRSPTLLKPNAPNTSPTSTQIVEGVRKMNKLKKLLGDEVSTHISKQSCALGVTPATNVRGDVMKPLPYLPPLGSLQRSNTAGIQMGKKTMLGSHKPREKKHCIASASTSGTGRPSTASETRCTCSNCDATQRVLGSALAGAGMRLGASHTLRRPNTSASVRARSIRSGGGFVEMDEYI